MKVKWIIGLLVGAVALLCSTGQGSEILSDDFDGYPTGQPPVPPWQEHYNGAAGSPIYTRQEAANLGVTIQVDDSVSWSSPKSVHFLDTNRNVTGCLSRTFSPTSSFVLEYFMRTHNAGYEGAFVAIFGEAGEEYQVAFSNGGYGGSAGWIGVHGSPAGWMYPELLEYTEDTWYYVRRELNLTTNVGRFYVEEVLDGHDVGDPGNASNEYSVGRNHANSYVNEIVLWSSWSARADCYIDELVLTPEPATLSLLALGGLAVLRRRR